MKTLASFLIVPLIFVSSQSSAAPTQSAPLGQLVVIITSKGQYSGATDTIGMNALAGAAHKYNFPVTWHLKPMHAKESADKLETWFNNYGDEVSWLADGTPRGNAERELQELQSAVKWHPIRSVAQIRYDSKWVEMFEKGGITSVWGRCFEQTYADAISDRGCPPGFYYLRPDVFKAPNNKQGGLISVPWLSNDVNLVYRLGWQSSYTFDPDDVLSIGGITADNIEYWKALIDEYINQGRYNAVNPLVIQDEYPSVGNSVRTNNPAKLAALDKLFSYLHKKNVLVVSQSKAVELYKKSYPEKTPPTYAIYNNLGNQELVRKPFNFPRLHRIKTVTERLTKANAGPSFNGFYANDRREEPSGEKLRYVYSHDGKEFFERGKLFVYYDVNGMLMFDEGCSLPERITSYYDIPKDSYRATVLPEMSQWYDTARFIPQAKVAQINGANGLLVVSVTVPAVQPNIVSQTYMSYGVMLWGDYSKLTVPSNAPEGTKIVGEDGLFIPILLTVGKATQLQLTFPCR